MQNQYTTKDASCDKDAGPVFLDQPHNPEPAESQNPEKYGRQERLQSGLRHMNSIYF